MREYSIIGKSIPRVDSKPKSTGEAKYASDMVLSNMLYGKILRSPYPHAKVLNIDTSRAEKLLGVKAIVTGKDTSGVPFGPVRMFPSGPDKLALAIDKVRVIGDEVAAVAAIDEDTAEEALELIKVEYELLKPLFDPEEAMKEGVPRIHDYAENNISTRANWHLGDVDRGFKESDYIKEETFRTQMVVHSPMEPHAVIASYDSAGKLTVWASTQTPFFLMRDLSFVLGIPQERVRVIKPYVGGGFGGKAETNAVELICAFLSKKSGRPVKLVYTREEENIATSRRHPMVVWHKIGVKKDGKIVAKESRVILDGGAYNYYGPITTLITGALQNGPYRLENFKFEGIRVYTNKPACGAQRGHGGIEPAFATECLLDMIAEDLNLDPLEIRIKNGLKRGDVAPNKFRIKSSGHVESIEKASRAVGWRDNWKKLPKGTGIGIGANFFASGAGWHFHYDTEIPHSTVKIEVSESGSVTLLSGASDIGQGIETVLTQIAAEELGVNVEDIRIIAADTGVTPVDLGSYSSRVTLMAGNAAKMAAKDAKEKLLKIAADMLEANVEDLEASNRRIYVKGSPEKGKSFVEVVRACLNKTNAPVIGNGYYYPPVEEFMLNFETGEVNLSPTYSFGAHSALVKVDMETGEVRVETLAAAHDCGVAINPMSVEGQIEGSVSMAFGQALLENFWFDGGQMLNPSLLNYKLATSLDMPETKPIIVESDDPEGPFGAKEASEGVLIPTMPAIANAVYNAIGVRIKELPITPEKVLRGLEKKKGGGI